MDKSGDFLLDPALSNLLSQATVPEHSIHFMQAMSGGKGFIEQNYLFLTSDDWLMGIGYPLDEALSASLYKGSWDKWHADGASAFTRALDAAVKRTNAQSCWAIAPILPDHLLKYGDNQDSYYVLPVEGGVPPCVRRNIAKAAARLRIIEDREFSASHRRLWAELMARGPMRPAVRELYARTEHILSLNKSIFALEKRKQTTGCSLQSGMDIRLLNAWDEKGNLAASLLIDYSPKYFCSYIIGAHSREHYTPYATDLLFAEMIKQCQRQDKSYIHLGLGVNEGIARFKSKWGARPLLPYTMASWKEQPLSSNAIRQEITQAVHAFLDTPAGLSKQQIFDSLPRQREFGMIREVRKGDALSYLCGSAHFFCYSFEFSFRDMFESLDAVVFEGPLDEDFLAAVEKKGKNPDQSSVRLQDFLSDQETASLEKTVYGPEGYFASLLGMQKKRSVDVRYLLQDVRPWFAFFSLWVAFLERQGWNQSVDLEAWRIAKDMGIPVIAMEDFAEQIASLEAIPTPRIINFIQNCEKWPAYMKRNISSYLDGNLEQMMGTSIEFPSRTEAVIDRRDERFRQRMRPFIEAGNCAVFVGTAHLVGLTPMLEDDGFSIKERHPGLMRKIGKKLRFFSN